MIGTFQEDVFLFLEEEDVQLCALGQGGAGEVMGGGIRSVTWGDGNLRHN